MTKATGGTPGGRRTSLLVRMTNAARDAGVVARVVVDLAVLYGLLVAGWPSAATVGS